MEEIRDIYEKVKSHISPDHFHNLVEEKMRAMGNLCDLRTAALLVASEFGAKMEVKIVDIQLSQNVVFIGKIKEIRKREFKKADGSSGKVSNLVVGDETSSVRVVFWDDVDFEVGDTIKIKGIARNTGFGMEVGARSLEPVEISLETKKYRIEDIKGGMISIDLVARVLEISQITEFKRPDGSHGKLRSMIVGDETGHIRALLWGENAEKKFSPGSCVEIRNAYTKENFGIPEIHIGTNGEIKESSASVEYLERISNISDIGVNERCNLIGFVSGIGSVREITTKSGASMKVGNIHISDDTGRIRVSLWGKHAELMEKIDIGKRIKIVDGYAKIGFNNEIEINVGRNGKVEFL